MARHAYWPDVSPLLDVILVLTILFAPGIMRLQGVIYANVDHEIVDRWPAVTVIAGPHETMRINGHSCTAAELRGRTVRLLADSGALYQDVLHALDVARGAGAYVFLEYPRHP